MSKFFAFLETVVILGAFILFSNTKFKYSKNLRLIIEKKNKKKNKNETAQFIKAYKYEKNTYPLTNRRACLKPRG